MTNITLAMQPLDKVNVIIKPTHHQLDGNMIMVGWRGIGFSKLIRLRKIIWLSRQPILQMAK